MHDVRSTTGCNLRKILLLTEKSTVDDLMKSDVYSMKYNPTGDDDLWKEQLLDEILLLRDGAMTIENLDHNEIKDIINDICTN